MYYFYLLQSINKPDKIYTGSTNNLRSRFSAHNIGKIFSTKRYLPWRLIYYEAYLSEKDARMREQKFKRHGKGSQELKKRLGNSLNIFKKGEGFTLLEVLLSIAIIGLLLGIGAPLYQNFQNRNDLDTATQVTAQSLRRAQVLSQAVAGDTFWGVYLQSGSITLFKGTSFAGRDSSYDEIFNIPATIALSGLNEMIFNKFSGLPQTTGTISLTHSATNETKNIVINTNGTVSY